MQTVFVVFGEALSLIDIATLVLLSFIVGWRTRRTNRKLILSFSVGMTAILVATAINAVLATGLGDLKLLFNLLLSIELGRIVLFCVASGLAISVAQIIKSSFSGRRLFSKK